MRKKWAIEFKFLLNDQMRQQCVGSKMVVSPLDLVVYASHYFPLSEGDILFTGTPAGVGKVSNNDRASLHLGKYAYSVVWDK